jgi:hypothetical protein
VPGDCRVRVEAAYLLHCLTVSLSQQEFNTRTAPTKSTGQWYFHEFKRRSLADVVSICAHDHHLRRPDMPFDLSHLLLVQSDRLDECCPSKCTASRCWRTMSDCGAYQRGAVSALPHCRNSNASSPGICVIFLRRSRRPSRNAREDLMGVCIVHGRSMVEDLSYSMIPMVKSCQAEIEPFHMAI